GPHGGGAGPPQVGRGSGLAQHGLDLEVHVHLVADHRAAAVERHLDVDAEVVAVDRGGGGEAGTGAAPRVLAESVDLQGQRHRAGHALDRQLTVQGEAVVGDAQAGRAEGPLRMVLDVEEVGRADVVVALLVVRVDGACVDLRGDRRVGQVLGGDDLAGELPEVAAYLADHHVADGERDVGVILVDVPGARDVAGDRGGGRCGRHRSSL